MSKNISGTSNILVYCSKKHITYFGFIKSSIFLKNYTKIIEVGWVLANKTKTCDIYGVQSIEILLFRFFVGGGGGGGLGDIQYNALKIP